MKKKHVAKFYTNIIFIVFRRKSVLVIFKYNILFLKYLLKIFIKIFIEIFLLLFD